MTFHCWVFRRWVFRGWVFEAYYREYPTRNLELGIPAAGYSRCWVFRTRTVLYSFLALSNPRDQSGYRHIKTVIKNLTPLNDCSERHLALSLANAYSGTLTQEDN